MQQGVGNNPLFCYSIIIKSRENPMSVPNSTSLHIDFNDWLAQCPVQWFRENLDSESVTYQFILPDDDEDE